MLYSIKQAARKLGVHPQTLRRWERDGKISVIRTQGGHRRYDFSNDAEATTVCYCRVASAGQKDDLARQVEYMRERFPDAEVVTDIGRGLNFKRRGLNALLDRLARGEKLTVVVAHRDRLARFGVELIERLINQNNGELVVLDAVAHSPPQELTHDILSILTVFSARVSRFRRYHNQIKEDTSLPKQTPESAVQTVDQGK